MPEILNIPMAYEGNQKSIRLGIREEINDHYL